jgi:hypothetical protein
MTAPKLFIVWFPFVVLQIFFLCTAIGNFRMGCLICHFYRSLPAKEGNGSGRNLLTQKRIKTVVLEFVKNSLDQMARRGVS